MQQDTQPLDAPSEALIAALWTYKRRFRESVRAYMPQGDLVRNGSAGYYVIDDLPGILSTLRAHDGVDAMHIRSFFPGNTEEIRDTFRTAEHGWKGPQVPFSHALKRQLGGCLEIALAAHLVRTNRPRTRAKSILVTAYVEDQDSHEGTGWTYHGFNFRQAGRRVLLMDLACPDVTKQKPVFEFPVLNVEDAVAVDGRRGAMITVKRHDGRRYFLPTEYSTQKPFYRSEL